VDQVDQLELAQVKVHLGHLKAPNSAISQGKVGIDSRHLHLPAALLVIASAKAWTQKLPMLIKGLPLTKIETQVVLHKGGF
jgi:hypothetical protein